MASQQELQFAIRAVNEASRVLKDVSGDVTKLGQDGEKSGGLLKGLGGALGDVAKIAGGFVVGAGLMKLPGFLMDAAKGAAEDEAATRRLAQTFENYAKMAGAAPDTFERLNALLEDRIKIGQDLAFTDDQVRDSFNTLLAATDDSTEAVKRQQAAFDLSRGAGVSLEQATRMLGKISAENVEVFKKLGITLGENATEADALAAVQARFGGQAEAYAKSTAGQFEQTSIRMAELKEQIGAQLLPIMTKIGEVLINDVVPKLEQFANYWATQVQPKIEKWWNEDAKPILEAIWKFIETEVMPRVKENFAKFQTYYETDIKPALDNIKTAIREVVEFLIEHWGQIEPFVRPILIAIELAFNNTMAILKIAIDLLGGDWKGAVDGMKEIWNNTVEAFDDTFSAVKDQILVAAGLLKAGFEGIVDGVEAAVTGAINAIIGLINMAIEAYNKLPLAPNVSTIGTGGSGSSSTTGNPVPGGDDDQMPGREVFGQTAEANSMEGPRGAYNNLMRWEDGAWLDGPSAYIPPGAQHVTIVQVQGQVWALDDLMYEMKRRGFAA